MCSTLRKDLVGLMALVLALATHAPSVEGQGAVATRPPAATRVEYVLVEGADYAFKSPPTVNSGVVAFNLVNVGQDLHAMALLELPGNHTLREFLDMYQKKGIIPPWMPTLGQTATLAPKQETFLTARLKPGRYILACLIPGRDGRAHTEKGMVQLITAK
ncbi:hypothetical protein [Gemmatimonas sp.]|uniref:hypothetical protein n=1 Tax=Gemmatimonas sp. TaxID=1962908 RepID=UPI0025B87933|nr:hypothetical protein [Gemmatimonas sp.]MCA2989391.1 hypothetical protein [Gemmatimonas sp.]MCA2996881.1 hypothetical protein [Gemmatimonas sp.]